MGTPGTRNKGQVVEFLGWRVQWGCGILRLGERVEGDRKEIRMRSGTQEVLERVCGRLEVIDG